MTATGQMLQYVEVDVPQVRFTSFGTVHEGQTPSNWISRWQAGSTFLVEEIADMPTGFGGLMHAPAAQQYFWSYTPADNLLDVSVLTCFKRGSSFIGGVLLRGTASPRDGYLVRLEPDEIAIYKIVGGSATLLAIETVVDEAGDIIWLRADVFTGADGTVTVRAKRWVGSSPADEPGDTTIFAIDDYDEVLAGDHVGLYASSPDGSGVSYDVGLFHVTTLGAETDTYRFAVPSSYLPSEIEAIPSVANISYQAQSVSLGEGLGQRATVSVTFRDHPHRFSDEPFDTGTFWGKWRATFGQTLRGQTMRIIQGFVGQDLSSMETRYAVIEKTDGPTPAGAYSIAGRDPIKFMDDDRAQAPVLSNGSLGGSITNAQTSITVSPSGVGDTDYPNAPFYACIGGKEVVLVYARYDDAMHIIRGQLNTTAIAHSAGDRVQLVLYYPGNTMAEIAYDLITTYTGFDPALIQFDVWETEMSLYLPVLFGRAITEPTGVNKLLSDLIEQSGTAMAWDDVAATLRLQVLRQISTDAELIDEEVIVADSLRVQDQPDTRISQQWVYYGQRDPTDRADNSDNFRATLADVDLERETKYGGAVIKKVFGSWVPTLSAADRLNQIVLSRFRDPPRRFTFDLFQGAALQILGGYHLSWRANQDVLGNTIVNGAPIQITKISAEPGLVHIEAEEMLASGVVALINCVILTDTSGVLEWEVPADWDNADNSIHVLGAGGGGGGESLGPFVNGGGGGGGGAYSSVINQTLTPGALIKYNIGVGGNGGPSTADGTDGGDTWFGALTYLAATVAAKGGQFGHTSSLGGHGGAAASGIGTTRKSGGRGGAGAPAGASRAGGGGGGGAAGPDGDGGDGLGLTATNQDGGAGGGGADGGANATVYDTHDGGDGGNNRFAFGGGTVNHPDGQDGGGGKGGVSGTAATTGRGGDGEEIWTQTISPIFSAGPGGGGGGGTNSDPGGPGGDFGGGGGGAGLTGAIGGPGAQGCIVIIWAAT